MIWISSWIWTNDLNFVLNSDWCPKFRSEFGIITSNRSEFGPITWISIWIRTNERRNGRCNYVKPWETPKNFFPALKREKNIHIFLSFFLSLVLFFLALSLFFSFFLFVSFTPYLSFLFRPLSLSFLSVYFLFIASFSQWVTI